MTTLDSEAIQARALTIGTHVSWLRFLKSEATANKVAGRIWNELLKRGYGDRRRKDLVEVLPDESWLGVWTVQTLLPGVLMQGRTGVDREAGETAERILRAAYGPHDLATTCTDERPGGPSGRCVR